MPLGKFYRIGFGNISCQNAFPTTMVDFQKTLIRGNGEIVQVSAEFAGLEGALQGAGDGSIDGDDAQTFR